MRSCVIFVKNVLQNIFNPVSYLNMLEISHLKLTLLEKIARYLIPGKGIFTMISVSLI